MSADPKVRLNVRVDRALLRRLRRYCTHRGATQTYVVTEALDWYLRARSRMNDPDFVRGMRQLVRGMVDQEREEPIE